MRLKQTLARKMYIFENQLRRHCSFLFAWVNHQQHQPPSSARLAPIPVTTTTSTNTSNNNKKKQHTYSSLASQLWPAFTITIIIKKTHLHERISNQVCDIYIILNIFYGKYTISTHKMTIRYSLGLNKTRTLHCFSMCTKGMATKTLSQKKTHADFMDVLQMSLTSLGTCKIDPFSFQFCFVLLLILGAHLRINSPAWHVHLSFHKIIK